MRGARDVVHAVEHVDDPGHVVAALAAGQAAAEVEVVDRVRVEARHLVQRGLDDQRRQVVGAEVLERPLVGAADGGAGGGNDDCLGHGGLRSREGELVSPTLDAGRPGRGRPARPASGSIDWRAPRLRVPDALGRHGPAGTRQQRRLRRLPAGGAGRHAAHPWPGRADRRAGRGSRGGPPRGALPGAADRSASGR